ncbi:MAG: phage terminase large subunit [Acidimicrobiia bacterium]
MPAQFKPLTEEQLKLLTPAERAQYRSGLEKIEALNSPLGYGQYCSNMRAYDHVVVTEKYLLATMHGKLYKSGIGPVCVFKPHPDYPDDEFEGTWVHPITGEKAIFNLALAKPPRHGKSFHISEHLPAWFLTKYPDLLVGLGSYNSEFAARFGRKARELVKAHPELGALVNKHVQAADLWEIEGHRGHMLCAGREGGFTGEGWHLGVVDDPLKDAIEALSPTTRGNLENFWVSVFEPRRMPHEARMHMIYPNDGHDPGLFSICILMATRWHQGDLWGYVKENEDDSWYFLNMPALAFEDEESPEYGDPGRCVLGRSVGDPLEPRLYNRSNLLARANSPKGKFWFNALWQGTPKLEAGGIIPASFVRYSLPPVPEHEEPLLELPNKEIIKKIRCYEFATVDLAATTKTRSDYSVYAHWLVTPLPNRRLVLWAVHRRKLETPDLGPWIRRLTEQYRPSYVGIENKTYGLAVLQQLRKEGGVTTRPLEADGDKLSRALPFGDLVRGERVIVPEDASWLEDWVDEHLVFDKGNHDDQVDCSAYAAIAFNAMPQHLKTKNERPRTIEEMVEADMDAVSRGRKRRRRTGSILGRW